MVSWTYKNKFLQCSNQWTFIFNSTHVRLLANILRGSWMSNVFLCILLIRAIGNSQISGTLPTQLWQLSALTNLNLYLIFVHYLYYLDSACQRTLKCGNCRSVICISNSVTVFCDMGICVLIASETVWSFQVRKVLKYFFSPTNHHEVKCV